MNLLSKNKLQSAAHVVPSGMDGMSTPSIVLLYMDMNFSYPDPGGPTPGGEAYDAWINSASRYRTIR